MPFAVLTMTSQLTYFEYFLDTSLVNCAGTALINRSAFDTTSLIELLILTLSGILIPGR